MKKNEIKTIFFDVGNVIIFPNGYQIKNIIKQELDITVDDKECIKAFFNTDKLLFKLEEECEGEVYIKHWGKTLKLSPSQSIKIWNLIEKEKVWNLVNQDTIPTLEYLKSKRISLGIISNTDGALDEDLERFELTGYFETIIDSEKIGIRKPDKRIYQLALKREGINKSEACFIGDSIDEIYGAIDCGFQLVILFDPFNIHKHSDNYTIINSLKELKTIV